MKAYEKDTNVSDMVVKEVVHRVKRLALNPSSAYINCVNRLKLLKLSVLQFLYM